MMTGDPGPVGTLKWVLLNKIDDRGPWSRFLLGKNWTEDPGPIFYRGKTGPASNYEHYKMNFFKGPRPRRIPSGYRRALVIIIPLFLRFELHRIFF